MSYDELWFSHICNTLVESSSHDVTCQELEEMKKRLKEMEEEAAALRDMQAKVEKEMSAGQGKTLSIELILLVYW